MMFRLMVVPLIAAMVITGSALLAARLFPGRGYWWTAGGLASLSVGVVLSDRALREGWEGSVGLTILILVVPIYLAFGVVRHFQGRDTARAIVGGLSLLLAAVSFLGLLALAYAWG